jgi:hypothetical protein
MSIIPAAAMPSTAPAEPAVAVPVIIAPPVATPSVAQAPAPAPAATPVDIAKPVEASTLGDIDPQSIGLLSVKDGGLGADMWKGTAREPVDRLMPSLALPLGSPVLNNLAQRLLLTTANVPAGAVPSNPSLVATRVAKLDELGDVADAWKLTLLAKPEMIDEITLRMAAEAALSIGIGDVCPKLPNIMKAHTSNEWQKSLLVCQLRGGDTKAAQITIDLLHAQDVNDEAFIDIADHNIIGGNKQPPRQLTPLKPLTFALLKLSDLPLPEEIYAHPPAALVPSILAAKARDEAARLDLAERAASQGILSSADLAAVYRSVAFPAEAFVNPFSNAQGNGPRPRALLYQAAMQEKTAQKRIDYAAQFIHVTPAALLEGAGAGVLTSMVDGVTVSSDFYASSGVMVHIYLLAGKGNAAAEWLKLAKRAAIGMPGVAADLQSLWPITVLSGLEMDSDYAGDLFRWLDFALKPENDQFAAPPGITANPQADDRARRERAASTLLLLEAAGYAVAEDNWAKVADAPSFEKRATPPALLLERLRDAGVAGRRGEAVMIGLLLAGGSEPSPFATIETVRALRLVGLTADSAMLAREMAVTLSAPNPK